MEAFTAGLTTITAGITSAANWIWSIFSSVINMIMSNPLIAWPVLVALSLGAIGLVVAIVRGFGVRGRGARSRRRRRKRA